MTSWVPQIMAWLSLRFSQPSAGRERVQPVPAPTQQHDAIACRIF